MIYFVFTVFWISLRLVARNISANQRDCRHYQFSDDMQHMWCISDVKPIIPLLRQVFLVL